MAILSSLKKFWRKFNSFYKKLSKRERIALGVFIFLLIVIPLSVIAVRYQAYKSSKALVTPLTPPLPSPIPPPTPDTDSLTGEMYDLQIDSEVTTIRRTESGPLYVASTVFRLYGSRISGVNQLYGYVQNPATPYETEEVIFDFQGESGYPRFTSQLANLLYNNCIDLHSSSSRTPQDYIATFCYRITFVEPGKTAGIAYSSSGNPFIEFDYRGTETTTVQFLTTAFDKYQNPPPYDGINKKGIRVNYLTIDVNASSLSDFQNVRYIIQGLTSGLSEKERTELCTLGSSYPKKYLKQTHRPKPEGGSNYEITKYGPGGCAFELDYHALIPFYLSLYKERGIAPTPTPSPSPVLQPDLVITKVTPSITPGHLRIDYQIKNQGTAQAGENSSSFYIDGKYYWEADTVPPLVPGQSLSRTFYYGWTCTGESHEFKVCADSPNSISESNENNNCQTATFVCPTPTPIPSPMPSPTPSPMANLQVSDIRFYKPRTTIETTPEEGKLVTCFAVLKNTGNKDTGVFNVKWFLDGEQVGYGSHGNLPPNNQESQGNVRFDWTPKREGHTLKFVADVDNHVKESNEYDNQIEKIVYVKPRIIFRIIPIPSIRLPRFWQTLFSRFFRPSR